MSNSIFRRLILPGLILQSTMVGGGYATGRELVEFFLLLGPIAGLLAMVVSTVVISVVCMAAFEFARSFKIYDYRLFFRKLLGPGWVFFEVIYIALIILVLSVLGAASGELIANIFSIEPFWGSVAMMLLVAVLVFYGSVIIETFLSSWSIILYIAYIVLIIWSLSLFGDVISTNLTSETQPATDLNIFNKGFSFAGYNVISFIAVLFVIPHFKGRSDSIWAGLLCGPLAMIPGFLLLIAMTAHYPEINDKSLPISHLLDQLNASGFIVIFQIVIFGTFIETGTALLHSINERIAEVYIEKQRIMPSYLRPIVALGLMFVAIYLADKVGLVSLIGQGYAYIGYFMLVIVILPLLTRGLWLIYKNNN